MKIGRPVLAWTLAAAAVAAAPADTRSILAERVTRLNRDTAWTRVMSVPIGFTTHHPQGLVKIGDTLFVSSVEVTVPTRRWPEPVLGPERRSFGEGRLDRDAGQGRGHLFKIDMTGNLLADLKLGEGSIYHPGGLDYDGRNIWVAVAEYRPNSRSIIYRVDPNTMTATEVFRFADHIGAIVHNTDDHTLHGVSWGSRRFYRWPLARGGRITNPEARPEMLRTLNASHYVDYQDCKYVGRRRMLCTGVTELRQSPDSLPFRLGGIELVDLRGGRPLHQVPLLLWTASGTDMAHNPVWIEPSATGLRAYFMPEDDQSTLYVFEAATP